MSQERVGCFHEFRARRATARKEMHEAFHCLLPEAFWEHARASRREAKLACTAFRRAVKSQFRSPRPNKLATKQTIDIA